MSDKLNLTEEKEERRDRRPSSRSTQFNQEEFIERNSTDSTNLIPKKKYLLKDKSISGDDKLSWLSLKRNENDSIRTPSELEDEIVDPPRQIQDEKLLDQIQGSICGLAIGDALGAHVEFRPHEYLIKNPVTKMEGGGTWGLDKGQWTDDTSMAICLANSLIDCEDFIPYDQLIRYQWWYRHGYMSSTGQCFDIGAATSSSIEEFEQRQNEFLKKNHFLIENRNEYFDDDIMKKFDIYCSSTGVAGNGGLMRLAPVPLFFFRNVFLAIEFSGRSTEITHGDQQAKDASRYFGCLIASILRGKTKEEILHKDFYLKHRKWFGNDPLHDNILKIAKGSFKKRGGYEDGIRGKGFVVQSLEAALWAFWSTDNFRDGALAAVNLGDDTDTTAAIYGQIAGAYYGYKSLPDEWLKDLYARKYLESLSKWILYKGERWENKIRSEFS